MFDSTDVDDSDLVRVAEQIEVLVDEAFLATAHRLADSARGMNFRDALRREIRKPGEKQLELNVTRLLELHVAHAVVLFRPSSLNAWAIEAAASMRRMLAEEGYPRDEFNAWVEPICEQLLVHEQNEGAGNA